MKKIVSMPVFRTSIPCASLPISFPKEYPQYFLYFGRLIRWKYSSSLPVSLSRTALAKSARNCSGYNIDADFFAVGQLYPRYLHRSIACVVLPLLCCLQEYFCLCWCLPVLRCLLLRRFMSSILLAIFLFSSRHCPSPSIPMAYILFAPLRLWPPFELEMLPCTPFECWCRIRFSWLGLWRYSWGSRLIVVFYRLMRKCLPVRFRCRHLLVAARPCLWLLSGSDICVKKIPSGPLVYSWFLGSKLYGTNSVPMMSLGSKLSWCDFPTFFVRWAWRASWPHSRAGQTSGSHNHVGHTCVQRLILSSTPLIFVAGLVGALHREGSDTIVSREIFYLSHTILIRSGIWRLGCLSRKYSVCGHGVAQVGISYHYYL